MQTQNTHHLLAISSGNLTHYALCKANTFQEGDIVKPAPGAPSGVVVDVAFDYSGDALRMLSRSHCIHTDLILVSRGSQDEKNCIA